MCRKDFSLTRRFGKWSCSWRWRSAFGLVLDVREEGTTNVLPAFTDLQKHMRTLHMFVRTVSHLLTEFIYFCLKRLFCFIHFQLFMITSRCEYSGKYESHLPILKKTVKDIKLKTLSLIEWLPYWSIKVLLWSWTQAGWTLFAFPSVFCDDLGLLFNTSVFVKTWFCYSVILLWRKLE